MTGDDRIVQVPLSLPTRKQSAEALNQIGREAADAQFKNMYPDDAESEAYAMYGTPKRLPRVYVDGSPEVGWYLYDEGTADRTMLYGKNVPRYPRRFDAMVIADTINEERGHK